MEQEHFQSYHALQIAFQTMKERCQQLQARLFATEKESICLPQQNEEYNSVDTDLPNDSSENKVNLYSQKIIEELKKQKSMLIHHIYMISSENRQLWIRLGRLIHTNKLLESLKPDISDKNIEHNIEEKKHSSKEALCFNNSSSIERSELKAGSAEINKVSTNTEINLGFTYLEDISEDSLVHLKYHDAKLIKIKEALLSQQQQLSNILQNLKKVNKNKICDKHKQKNKDELVHHTKTQIDLKNSLKESETTQTSTSILNLMHNEIMQISDDSNENICPICGIMYKITLSFDSFHEHVVGHFIKEIPDNFKLTT